MAIRLRWGSLRLTPIKLQLYKSVTFAPSHLAFYLESLMDTLVLIACYVPVIMVLAIMLCNVKSC